MWLFFTSRIRRWLLMAVAVPVLLKIVRLIRQTVEKRSGQNTFTRTLRRAEDLAQRRKAGPKATSQPPASK